MWLYNQVRLHSALGYITPADKLAGREKQIAVARDTKLEAARERRRVARQAVAEHEIVNVALGA